MKLTQKLALVSCLLAMPLNAQNANQQEVDPFLDEVVELSPESWDVTCEIFSLTLAEAAKLKRSGIEDAKYYKELVERVDSGKAIQEEFLTMRTVNGQPTSAEEISEMIYATEYEPPEIPNTIESIPEDLETAKILVTPAMPSAFDTKNVGITIEAELSARSKEKAQLALSLNVVRFLGRTSWGKDEATAEMPRFTVQNISTSLSLTADMPALVGTISPPAALQKENGEKRVWLAFVTISEARE